MEIDWKRQMMEFLKQHGWKEEDEGLISHSIFPMMEDVSNDKLLAIFVKDFYGKAWKSYRSLIEFYSRQEEMREVGEKRT